MRLILSILILAVIVAAAVHGFFYWATGSAEPCEAAVERIIQKQTARGNQVIATAAQTFKPEAVQMLRNEGIGACYRSALTGDAPEQITVRFKLNR